MNQTLAQHRALAAYRAHVNKLHEERRLARLNAIRDRLARRYLIDRIGWLFAAAAIGAAAAIVFVRVAT